MVVFVVVVLVELVLKEVEVVLVVVVDVNVEVPVYEVVVVVVSGGVVITGGVGVVICAIPTIPPTGNIGEESSPTTANVRMNVRVIGRSAETFIQITSAVRVESEVLAYR